MECDLANWKPENPVWPVLGVCFVVALCLVVTCGVLVLS